MLIAIGVCLKDVDECATSSRACASDRQCVDTVGSFRCICPEGTFENGTNCTGEETIQMSASCFIVPLITMETRSNRV